MTRAASMPAATTCAALLALGAAGTPQGRASNAHPDVSPDGARIVFDSDRTGNGDIYIMSAGGADVTRLTDDPAIETGAEWWADGTAIVFHRHVAGGRPRTLVMEPDGSRQRLLPEPEQVHWSWSHEGTSVLTGPRRSDEPRHIWIEASDGSGRRPITTFRPGSFNSDMSFSPDDRWILFESFVNEVSEAGIYVVPTKGGAARRLARGTDPRWSPDGSAIAYKFHDATTDRYWLHVMNADGSDDRVLGEGTYPRWFPDGRRLAYMAPVGDAWQVHVVDVVSGEVDRLTP